MAMNKKEKAYVEALKIKGALRFTEKVDPDLMPPTRGGELTKGYSFNAYSVVVSMACSSFTAHNSHSDEKTNSQQPIRLYSKKLSALKAMRHEMELKFARQLMEVDEMIEKEAADE